MCNISIVNELSCWFFSYSLLPETCWSNPAVYSWNPPSAFCLWRSSYPSVCPHNTYMLQTRPALPDLPVLRGQVLPPRPHNNPVQYSAGHIGQDSAKVIKPRLSAAASADCRYIPSLCFWSWCHTSMILAGLPNPQWLRAQARDLITKWCYLLMNLFLMILFVWVSHNFG